MTSAGENVKPRMLVVDDEIMGVRTLKALFTRSFAVDTATSVAEARTRFALESFDVAILDYHMPAENGLVLVEILRKTLPKERVFLTTADDTLKGLDEGRYTYVAKPLDPKRFIEKVTETVFAAVRPTINRV